MENSAEPSSSISFTSSSHFSNGSTNNKVYTSGGSEPGLNLEVISLSKLSCNLGQLFSEFGSHFSDADIMVEGNSVAVHRCVLASRSKFFDDLFRKDKGFVGKEGKPKYYMTNLLPYGKTCYRLCCGIDVCIDSFSGHGACLLFQRRLLNLVGKAIVENVIPVLTVAFHCQLSQLLTHCVEKVARSDLETIFLEKTLPSMVTEEIRLLRLNLHADQENHAGPTDLLHEKRVKRLHKALDSDDIELVRLLLTESDITLDEAFALHYAVAYCDPKIVTEVLSLGLADVNLRNARGYTVIHVTARRKEPSIIVSLLTKGACASEPTSEGWSAVSICKRLTRPKDYQMKREKGQEANKDRICIDVLEREMRRNPVAGDVSITSLVMADDLHMKLLYLEDRVAFARMFFPTEAKLAMEIAHAETTNDLAGLLSSRGSNGNLMEVDLNETPISQKKRLISKIETLSRTVELGRRYFPHCSQVLDKFMEDDLPDAFYLETGTPEEQRMKRMRFMELRDEVHKAFNKDKAKLNRSGFSSSSPSSFKDSIGYRV